MTTTTTVENQNVEIIIYPYRWSLRSLSKPNFSPCQKSCARASWGRPAERHERPDTNNRRQFDRLLRSLLNCQAEPATFHNRITGQSQDIDSSLNVSLVWREQQGMLKIHKIHKLNEFKINEWIYRNAQCMTNNVTYRSLQQKHSQIIGCQSNLILLLLILVPSIQKIISASIQYQVFKSNKIIN